MVHPNVRTFILQGDIGDKQAMWITKIQEYDVEIHPTKLVRGRALCQGLIEVATTSGLIAYQIEDQNLDRPAKVEENVDQINQMTRYFQTGIAPQN